jgi:hypothetical protein
MAFTAAADSTRFPEQFQFGVKPWQQKESFGTRLISAVTTPRATSSLK